MRGPAAFPCGLPESNERKLSFAKLCGADSADSTRAPIFVRQLTNDKRNERRFCFRGALDSKPCMFVLDTGSDVTLVNEKFVNPTSSRLSFERSNLRYSTGEKVPVTLKTKVVVSLEKFCETLSPFICEIQDDCILGGDFFGKMKSIDDFC